MEDSRVNIFVEIASESLSKFIGDKLFNPETFKPPELVEGFSLYGNLFKELEEEKE